WEDLREAMANVEAGLAEPIVYTEKETLAVARHEMGHAVANRFFLPDMKSVRLSIRKRGGALGHHQAVEAEESFLKFRSRLAGEIRWGLGSIAVERVFYGENTSGVSGDLASATREAAFMVGLYGMGPDRRNDEDSLRGEMIGYRLIAQSAGLQAPQGDPNPVAAILSQRDKARDVAQILGSAYVDCWRLMLKNKEAIVRFAQPFTGLIAPVMAGINPTDRPGSTARDEGFRLRPVHVVLDAFQHFAVGDAGGGEEDILAAN